MRLRYREGRVWVLAVGVWIATAGIWLVAPGYIPFRMANLDPETFASRSWPVAAFGSVVLSLLAVRHIVRMIVGRGLAETAYQSITTEKRGSIYVVQTEDGRTRRYASAITKLAE
jgi:hypothetical protein